MAEKGVSELSLQAPERPPRLGIVAARFNHFITTQLVEGAMDALGRHGVPEDHLTLAWVPGAFELPLAAERLLAAGQADAVIALGAVVRGGTPHFDYVAGECARGLSRVSLDTGKPVIFGVLTTDTVEQAMVRAGVSDGNKGYDAALAALHMLGLLERLAAPNGGD
jgi:6,7-dimethyl-8-ribityllumazine synthase